MIYIWGSKIYLWEWDIFAEYLYILRYIGECDIHLGEWDVFEWVWDIFGRMKYYRVIDLLESRLFERVVNVRECDIWGNVIFEIARYFRGCYICESKIFEC